MEQRGGGDSGTGLGDRARGHACGGRSCDSASVAGTVPSVGGSVAQRNSGKTRNERKRKKITHRCPVSERACDKELRFFFFVVLF